MRGASRVDAAPAIERGPRSLHIGGQVGPPSTATRARTIAPMNVTSTTRADHRLGLSPTAGPSLTCSGRTEIVTAEPTAGAPDPEPLSAAAAASSAQIDIPPTATRTPRGPLSATVLEKVRFRERGDERVAAVRRSETPCHCSTRRGSDPMRSDM